MACRDCEKKASGASGGAPQAMPPDTINTAAALWVSVGKQQGFGIACKWADDVLAAALAKPRGWRGERDLLAAIAEARGFLTQQAGTKVAEAKAMEETATSMMSRLDAELALLRRRGDPRPRLFSIAFATGVALGATIAGLVALLVLR